MYKNNFKNAGFPPLKYCDGNTIKEPFKQPFKERLYTKPLSKENIQLSLFKENNQQQQQQQQFQQQLEVVAML